MTAGPLVERHYWKDGGHRSPLPEIEWEFFPREEKRKHQGLERLFKWLALNMDEAHVLRKLPCFTPFNAS